VDHARYLVSSILSVGHKKKGGGVQFLQQHVAGNVN